jgi:hypothetical protein
MLGVGKGARGWAVGGLAMVLGLAAAGHGQEAVSLQDGPSAQPPAPVQAPAPIERREPSLVGGTRSRSALR